MLYSRWGALQALLTLHRAQAPEARRSQAFAGLADDDVIAATTTPARPCFSHTVSQAEHILLHLWAFAHTVLSAWNVLWLPVPGSSDQELGELSSNPAHFTSEPPVHAPRSSSLATSLVWTLSASAILSLGRAVSRPPNSFPLIHLHQECSLLFLVCFFVCFNHFSFFPLLYLFRE